MKNLCNVETKFALLVSRSGRRINKLVLPLTLDFANKMALNFA